MATFTPEMTPGTAIGFGRVLGSLVEMTVLRTSGGESMIAVLVTR